MARDASQDHDDQMGTRLNTKAREQADVTVVPPDLGRVDVRLDVGERKRGLEYRELEVLWVGAGAFKFKVYNYFGVRKTFQEPSPISASARRRQNLNFLKPMESYLLMLFNFSPICKIKGNMILSFR